MIKKIFKNNPIYLSHNLPKTIMSLEGWCVVNVIGSDSKRYLNQQFTLNMNLLNTKNYQFGVHCNYNGKVWSPLLIFQYNNFYAYIIRTSLVLKQIEELKKYSIFSDIEIHLNKNMSLFGISGFNSSKTLRKYFDFLPNKRNNIVYLQDLIIFWFKLPIERFLIICTTKKSYIFLKKISKKMFQNNSVQWECLDIESGFPIIDINNSAKFLPQSLNLNFWNAISYNKGCYYGQEILYRVEKKGTNKFCIKLLIGYSIYIPKIGSNIEYLDNNKEIYHVGVILSIVRLYNDQLLIQVCIKNNFCKKGFSFYIPLKYDNKFTFYYK